MNQFTSPFRGAAASPLRLLVADPPGHADFLCPRCLGSGLGQVLLEAVEDEVEAELVLVAVVVAGLEDVLDGQLGEARVLLGGELQQEGLREL